MASEAEALVQRPRAEPPPNVPRDRVVEVDMYALEGLEEGFQEAWKRVQRPGAPDMVWTPFNGGHWIATSGAAIREIFSDPERFSSEVIFLPKEAGEKYQMVPTRMDPPEHTPYRKALSRGLSLGHLKTVRAKIHGMAEQMIAELAARGECDFARDYARIFPVRVFMALADLPIEDAEPLAKLANQMTRPDGDTPEAMARSLDQANKGFFAYVEPLIAQRLGSTGDDLITLVVNSDINGATIEHDKALGLISLLLLGGLDTVVNLLSFMMIYLARHPEKVAELRETPDLVSRGVEEIFRRFAVVADGRMVARDIDYRGVQLRKGDMVLLPTPLHGLDERENSNAWDLDFHRKEGAHSTFGAGPHRCAGAQLARMEVIATLEAWLKHIPRFQLRPGAEPVYQSGTIASVDHVRLVWPTP